MTDRSHRSIGMLPLCALIFLLATSSTGISQTRCWIEFRDKGIAPKDFIPRNPIFESTRRSLSDACLFRRSLALNEPPLATISLADAPIASRYLDSLRTLGIRPLVQYKWGNAISTVLTPAQIKVLRNKAYIREIVPVSHAQQLSTEPTASIQSGTAIRTQGSLISSNDEILSDSGCGYDPIIYGYGGSQSELDRINVWPLHAMGFDGMGVRLGMLDVGFGWRDVSSLDSSDVTFEYDYVFQDTSTANPEDGHGTQTMSTAMGYLPDSLIGPAYKCSVMLAHTEDTRSERNIEEDNYAAALEDFEARGVEVTSSSLGYFTFDSGQHSYTYADMNGHTAICTRAVERAAKLGVLVVTAMGNNGADSAYPHEEAPADADSILGVGALDVNDSIAGFSSRGPTYDGRIKPDICAPGVNCFAQNSDGSFTAVQDGTSYATPLVAGVCCLIKQAHPEATAQQIRHAVMTTGTNAAHPDTAYGWGKINAYAAALELGTIIHVMNISVDSEIHFCIGAASKDGLSLVRLEYFADSDINPEFASFSLAADSLIYSCSAPLPAGTHHLYYRIDALDDSGSSAMLPQSGWDELTLPLSGVAQVSEVSQQITAFPNPCASQFQLRTPSAGHWRVLDMLGYVVRSGTSQVFGATSITTDGIANGAYEIEFISFNGSTQTGHIIVAH